jgi:hypothetical protein
MRTLAGAALFRCCGAALIMLSCAIECDAYHCDARAYCCGDALTRTLTCRLEEQNHVCFPGASHKGGLEKSATGYSLPRAALKGGLVGIFLPFPAISATLSLISLNHPFNWIGGWGQSTTGSPGDLTGCWSRSLIYSRLFVTRLHAHAAARGEHARAADLGAGFWRRRSI